MKKALLSLKNTIPFLWIGILFFLSGLIVNASLHGGDFRVFYLSGARFLSHAPLYQTDDLWSPFKYFPAWAAFFSAWSLLPFSFSLIIFTIVNLTFWADGARRWAQLLNYEIKLSSVFFLLTLSMNAISAETGYGQTNGFLFWGCTRIFIWMEGKNPKPFRSGILLAIMASLKLNFALLLAYVVWRNWRSLIGFLVGAAGLHLAVVVMFQNLRSVDLYRSWLTLLLTQSSDQYFTFEVQGFLHFCAVLFGEALAKPAWAALLVIFVTFGLYLDRYVFAKITDTNKKTASIGSYWLGLIFFFSPLTWWYQVLYLFPMAFLILKTTHEKARRYLVYLCLFCFSVISYNTLGHDGIHLFKSYLGYFIAAMILFVLMLESFFKSPQNQNRP